MDYKVRFDVQKFVHLKYRRQKQNILKLKSSNNNNSFIENRLTDNIFHPRFVNLTSVVFSEEECKLIDKGFKYNIQSFDNRRDFESLGGYFE